MKALTPRPTATSCTGTAWPSPQAANSASKRKPLGVDNLGKENLRPGASPPSAGKVSVPVKDVIHKLHQQIQGLSKQVAKQQLDIHDSRDIIDRQQGLLQALEIRLSKQQEELHASRKLAAAQQTEIRDLRIDLQSQQTEIREWRNIVEQQHDEIRQLKEGASKQKSTLVETCKALSIMRDARVALANQIEELRGSKNAAVQQLQERVDRYQTEVRECRQTMSRQKADIQDATVLLAKQQEEVRDCKAAADEQAVQVNEAKQQVLQKQAEVRELHGLVRQQQQEIMQLWSRLHQQDMRREPHKEPNTEAEPSTPEPDDLQTMTPLTLDTPAVAVAARSITTPFQNRPAPRPQQAFVTPKRPLAAFTTPKKHRLSGSMDWGAGDMDTLRACSAPKRRRVSFGQPPLPATCSKLLAADPQGAEGCPEDVDGDEDGSEVDFTPLGIRSQDLAIHSQVIAEQNQAIAEQNQIIAAQNQLHMKLLAATAVPLASALQDNTAAIQSSTFTVATAVQENTAAIHSSTVAAQAKADKKSRGAVATKVMHLGLLLHLASLILTALRYGRATEVRRACENPMGAVYWLQDLSRGSWKWGQLKWVLERTHAMQPIAAACCYITEMGFVVSGVLGLVLLYQLWKVCLHSTNLTDTWAFDIVLMLGVVMAAAGSHIITLLGGSWAAWLLLWWAWCAGLVTQCASKGLGTWKFVVLWCVALPVACGWFPFTPSALEWQFEMQELGGRLGIPDMRQKIWEVIGRMLAN